MNWAVSSDRGLLRSVGRLGAQHVVIALTDPGFQERSTSVRHRVQANFSWKPPPLSSTSLPLNIELKSTSPGSPGASPRIGALGLAWRLRFSCPALDGNVGNIAVGFGLGSSLKYACSSISFADGRCDGSRDNKLLSSFAPALVKVGNLERTIEPCAFLFPDGRRRDLALGRRLKPGQFSSVGIPQSSNICGHIR